MKTKVSFWLIPSEEDRTFFQEIIDTLAQEYDAPVFTPHVTIYSGECASDESPSEILEQATLGIQSFSLKVDNILYSQEFTKILFVQFHPNSILSQISETIRSSLKTPSDFTLNPHMSLIYQQISEETKKKLSTSISLPKSELFFDEVSAVSTPEKVQKRKDVERWKVIYTSQLKSM